jgi:low affinity Fe/Cu permease
MDSNNSPAYPDSTDSSVPGGKASDRDGNSHSTLHHKMLRAFDRFASHVTRWAGSPLAFTLAFIVVLAWAISGPVFHYSETWQLVINTGTTIITFLMVFLIQQSQNKDSQAMHLKLDELLEAVKDAREEMIDIEDLSEEELQKLAEQFKRKTRL